MLCSSVIVLVLFITPSVFSSFCPALKICENLEKETDRWDCINRYIFRPIPTDSATTDNSINANNNKRNKKKKNINYKFVEYNCGGVGWGNSIRAFYTGVSLAMTTGRRLILQYPAFNRNFLPPNESVSDWHFGASYNHEDMDHFDFAQHGQNPGRYTKWSELIRTNSTDVRYKKKVLNTGICGGEGEFLSTGGCMNKLLVNFIRCTHEDQVSMNIPFFYYLMRRPGPFIQTQLQNIRARLSLPVPGPSDHHIGLRSPGYYILALHFRRIPVGFEPEAVNLNNGRQLELRMTALKGFWAYAKVAAKRAKEISSCRQEQLFIYFASDDVELRQTAISQLDSYGRVVFGLLDYEVGHVSPGWMDRHFDSDTLDTDLKKTDVDIEDRGEIVSKMKHSRDKSEYLGDMSMVEWWILAHSHWLVSSGYTSFSTSAGGIGLGPTGAMERLDVVHGTNHVSTVYRKDFSKPSCPVLGAASKKMAKKCPNRQDDIARML